MTIRYLLCLVAWVCPLSAQLLSPGNLAQPHAEWEGLQNCTQCHQLGERVSEAKCLDCHDSLAVRIRADLGYHAQLKDRRCIDCHSDHRGIDYHMVRWDSTQFDHDSTGYALTGEHASLRCDQCHTTRSYLGLQQDCIACHADPHQGQLDSQCQQCHGTDDWQTETFDHDAARFALLGEHQTIECAECHLWEDLPNGKQMQRFKPIEFAQCTDCHEDEHRGQLDPDCTACHVERSWKEIAFDHDAARFPLLGKHRDVKCLDCHLWEDLTDGARMQRFRPVEFAACADCHADPHQPSLGNDCERCHVVDDWLLAGDAFDHDAARFPLLGKHQDIECLACHLWEDLANGKRAQRFRDIAFSQCIDCHEDYHEGQFDRDCAACHHERDWKDATFDHDAARFPLLGKHRDVECLDCHRMETAANSAPLQRFRPVAFAQCIDCHEDYHGGQFDRDCAACHHERDWKDATFDHDASRFPLDGAHQDVACEACHLEETLADGSLLRRYRPIDTACQTCHGAL